MKVRATSMFRYKATAMQRRLHGGRCITEFRCEADGHPPLMVKGYGAHPSTRKADAIRRAKLLWARAADTAAA